MPGHARRSRLVALGLSVGGLAGIVTGMVATEQTAAEPVPATTSSTVARPVVSAPNPFTTGSTATPPSSPPTGRVRRTVTSAS